jgi:hypothetical protein
VQNIRFADSIACNLVSKGFSPSQLFLRGMIWRKKVPFLEIAQIEISSKAVKVANLSCSLPSQSASNLVAGITLISAVQHEDEGLQTGEVWQAIHIVRYVERGPEIVYWITDAKQFVLTKIWRSFILHVAQIVLISFLLETGRNRFSDSSCSSTLGKVNNQAFEHLIISP